MSSDVIFLTDCTLGRRIKLQRVVLDLTQWEVAARATEWIRKRGRQIRIQPRDIGYLEAEWRIAPWRKEAILNVLGLDDPDA